MTAKNKADGTAHDAAVHGDPANMGAMAAWCAADTAAIDAVYSTR